MTPIAAGVVLAVVLFDVTALSVLIPSIRLDLGSSSSGGQWVLTAYLLALAALLPVLARLALPRRALIAAGALAMAAGGVVAASADSTAAVVVGQAVAGTGAAAVLASMEIPDRVAPAALALPLLALALGPAIGGALGEHNWWRLFFWGGVPLAAVAAAAAVIAAPVERRGRPEGLGRSLAFGAGLVALGVLLVQSEPWGFGPSPIVQLIPLAVLLVGARQLGAAAVIWGAAAAVLAALCFLGPQYFELAHQLAPSHSGVLVSALTAPAVAGGVLGWWLGSMLPRRTLGLAGALVAGAGLIAFGTIEVHSGYALMGLAMALTGGGLGLAAGANLVGSALALIPPGAALGLAAAGAVFQHVQAQERDQGSDFAEALTQGAAVARALAAGVRLRRRRGGLVRGPPGYASVVRSSPSCGELTTTSSPALSHTLGSRAPPTPSGVPVATTSPGSSVISMDRYSTSAGIEWTSFAVELSCMRSPLRSSAMPIASGGPASSGVTSAGPNGAEPSKVLPGHPLRRLELVVPRGQVVQQRVAGHVLDGPIGRHVLAAIADHEGHLGLVVDLGAPARQRDGGAVGPQRGRELGEEGRRLRRLGAALRRVGFVVAADADQLAGPLDRRQQLDFRDLFARFHAAERARLEQRVQPAGRGVADLEDAAVAQQAGARSLVGGVVHESHGAQSLCVPWTAWPTISPPDAGGGRPRSAGWPAVRRHAAMRPRPPT